MTYTKFIRFGAYPIVFGSVATFVMGWSALGRSPWPACAFAALVGIAAVALLERLQPFAPDWNRDHDDTTTDFIHVLRVGR